jgi:ABC-type uncharacterized transport system substrate-binding protein
MLTILKRFSLAFTLIFMAAGLLLLSDLHNRIGAETGPLKRVALVSFANTQLFKDGEAGVIDGLAAAGFSDGGRMELTRFNADADIAIINVIARDVTAGGYDLIISLGTPALQAVANANRSNPTPHVYGLVADASLSGVGVSHEQLLQHPPHLVGVSSFVPTNLPFELAREMLPDLQQVGLVWTSGEANSLVFTEAARISTAELGITLLEANVDNSAGVAEAAASLVARGARAFWVSGDTTVQQGIGALMRIAQQARIPVFTYQPGDIDQGTLFDLGANFYEVGVETATIAASVLEGADPATIPVVAEIEPVLWLNTTVLEGLREPWRIPQSVIDRAGVLIDANGRTDRRQSAPLVQPLAKKWRLSLIQYANVVDVEEAEAGFLAGLKEAGLEEGRDYEVTIRNAQGDMVTVNALIDAAMVDGVDMLVTFSTPTLQAAIQRARNLPIVFTYVANAVIAGAGTSDTEHLPNVTGVYMEAAYDEMIALIRESVPTARVLGTLFIPSEINTVFHRDRLAEAAQRAGMELISIAANTPSDVPDAALALTSRGIDVVSQISGNLTASAFPSIAQAGRRARLPVFAFQTSQLEAGALAILARDYYDGGRESALMAARIMRGEKPADMPFQSLSSVRLVINPAAAREVGFTYPALVLKRAEVYEAEGSTTAAAER